MTLPTRAITAAERNALEMRYDGKIPEHHLKPRIDWPEDVNDLWQLLIATSIELDLIQVEINRRNAGIN